MGNPRCLRDALDATRRDVLAATRTERATAYGPRSAHSSAVQATRVALFWLVSLSRAVSSSSFSTTASKPVFTRCVIVHAYRRASYTSEPTNAEAPIWAAYGLPIEYPEIGVPDNGRLHIFVPD